MIYRTETHILKQLSLPKTILSRRLLDAIGVLKGRGAAARKEVRAMRREWDEREKRQKMLARQRG